ncbi:MAG: hypothetical protein CM15mV2_0910 [uncultured marine virus]|nr:MAG: hypothetical protein CM15mV2_0910 [uncultured marine virus]
MRYCDKNSNILEWGSEETIIPYRSPLDQRIHRYFPDFYIKVRDNDGKAKKYIIEIKPKKQCIEPKVQKRKLRSISEKSWSMPRTKQSGKQQGNTVLIDT